MHKASRHKAEREAGKTLRAIEREHQRARGDAGTVPPPPEAPPRPTKGPARRPGPAVG